MAARPARGLSRASGTIEPTLGEDPTDGTAASLVKSADRVLRIFDVIGSRGPLTFSEVAATLGLPASSTHNLLKTLARREYLRLDPDDRRYHLGLRLWEVAQAYVATNSLPRLAQPFMDRVVAETGETVQLARLDGVENVYLAISESPQPMKLVSAVGKRLYAHATGLGKVLLADLSTDELRRRLDSVALPAFTANTIVDPDALLAELAEVRHRDYAVDNEEYVIGCRCIAMPIRDASGRVVAAMSVSIPTPRYGPELADRTHRALRVAVDELSARLGHVARPAGTPA